MKILFFHYLSYTKKIDYDHNSTAIFTSEQNIPVQRSQRNIEPERYKLHFRSEKNRLAFCFESQKTSSELNVFFFRNPT
ncbi:hypothetical protein B9Z55_028333 [Caenorhabditis nigoni]|uniref:Uncharacterized protein n=1 Tax=Caenorhabditis nigoni TaxID=1611254 RepID=A0A2G5SCB6_9PELO|nr:hypothetical protein B9Z55_028333 [Caenorhabditis nigoni]